MANRQRSYPPEFRKSAIGLIAEQGYTHAEAAKRLGIPLHTLKYWLKEERRNGEQPIAEVQAEPDELKRLRKENRQLKLEVEILKSGGVLCQREPVKYAWIRSQRGQFPVALSCRILGVSLSGYYKNKTAEPSALRYGTTRLAGSTAFHARLRLPQGGGGHQRGR